jgi:superfamily II DNA helicase RecQ
MGITVIFGNANDMDRMYDLISTELSMTGGNQITDFTNVGDIVRRFVGASADTTRRNTLRDLSRAIGGKACLVLASAAFGMGVDVSNIRRVYHWGLPRRLEEYWQESGRGGRDGLRCISYVVIGASDKAKATTKRTSEALCNMWGLKYGMADAPLIKCRRACALGFFGDSTEEIEAGTPADRMMCCDLCAGRERSLRKKAKKAKKAKKVKKGNALKKVN